jgi:hypothetical protein
MNLMSLGQCMAVTILILVRYVAEDRLHANVHSTNQTRHTSSYQLFNWLQANPFSPIPRPIPGHVAQSRGAGRGDIMPGPGAVSNLRLSDAIRFSFLQLCLQTSLSSVGMRQAMLFVVESFGRTTGPPLLVTMQTLMSQPLAPSTAHGQRLGDRMSYASGDLEASVEEQEIRLRDLA